MYVYTEVLDCPLCKKAFGMIRTNRIITPFELKTKCPYCREKIQLEVR